jgi:hypothetical protein
VDDDVKMDRRTLIKLDADGIIMIHHGAGERLADPLLIQSTSVTFGNTSA